MNPFGMGQMAVGIGRREFISVLGSAAVAWPLSARSQQPTVPVVGFLSSRSPNESAPLVAAFRQGLRELGYVEGQNLLIAFRWADNRYDRLPTLASELVSLRVAVIAAPGGDVTGLAAKMATATIPIIAAGGDLVRIGLVTSLNRPGANVTGVSFLNPSLEPKRLEILHELVPKVTAIALLVNPNNPFAETQSKEAQAAALALGIQLHRVSAGIEGDLNKAIGSLAQQGIRALLVSADSLFNSRRDQLVALTEQHGVSALYFSREFPIAGGLISYGPSIQDGYRLVGVYTGRILKGEKPAELPVVQPTKFELVINLKTAKALGLDVPPTLLALADEVIE
jgi:putative tryptophan/tyrosine transport system substrate-binding protein